VRVGEYSYLLARKAGLSEHEADLLRMASPMHDVGKIGIPDSILNKPGKLTDEEYALMKTHATIGYGILSKSKRDIMQAAAIIAHQHHEKWDGTGYPRGLKGEEIHIYGRVVGLVDVFDALTSNRVYRKGMDLEKVLEIIHADRGKHFDPELVDLFLAHLDEFLLIHDRNPDRAKRKGDKRGRPEPETAPAAGEDQPATPTSKRTTEPALT
jgi:response regulator RpfG family c-di-GMP phosphodiesterase